MARESIPPKLVSILAVPILALIGLGGASQVACAQARVYVSNNGDNTVSEIDTSTNTVVATIRVGSGPEGVAVTPDGTRLYVANDGGAVWVIDTSNNSTVAKVTVGGDPYGVAITPDGTRVYVTEDNGAAVSAIDTSSNTVIARIVMPAVPSGVAIAPDGRHAYVASDGANLTPAVSVIDTSSNTVVATVGLAGLPWGIAVTPDGRRVYVANSVPTVSGGSAHVSVIDTSSNAVIANVPVGAGISWGLAITPDGTRAYVATGVLIGSGANNGVVSVIDTSSNTVVATVGVADPLGLAVTPDGTRVYVANDFNFSGASSASVIDTSSNTVVATVGVGGIPEWVAIAKGSGNPPPVCTHSLNTGGEAFPATGGGGAVSISSAAGCPWSLTSGPAWVTGATSGGGNGTLTYQVTANTAAARSATLTIAGQPYSVEQQAASTPGLNLIGSMPHIAAQENWTTSFTFVNKAAGSATARLSLFNDPSGALTLPLLFPQTAATLPELASTFDRTMAGNASLIVASAGPQTPPVQIGSAQLSGVGSVDGFAIFHLIPGSQEAVVPMETRNAGSYILAYDNTGGVVLGVAVANVSPQAGTVGIVLRDDTGAQIGTGSLPMQASGHTSFVLSSQFPATANKRGTIEFDRPSGGQISVLGIRTTPLGTSTTLTTIPALANVGTNGGSIAHIATGNGWQTTFVLVNTGTSTAQVNLNFYADVTGAPLSIPLSFPQTGTGSTASTVSRSLGAGASFLVQSAAPASNPTPTTGSAQLTTNGNVGGFVIFRYNPNGQEAVVPLESRTANGFVIAFDNTAGTATGIAINSVSSSAVSVPVVIRDDSGNQIGTDTLNLPANAHLAFTLVADKYPQTANIRGAIEFDTPPGGQIGALGIRIPVAHTFTTLPALAK